MGGVPDITSFIGEEIPGTTIGFEWVRPEDGKVVGRISEAGKSGVDLWARMSRDVRPWLVTV